MTADDVNSIAATLTGRATAAIEHLESQKSVMGALFGNNDTIQSTQGALRMLRDVQIPRWKQRGLDIASGAAEEMPGSWAATGQEFTKAISEIDGYGGDATLDRVVRDTLSQTATDIKDKALPALSFGIFAGLALVVGLYFTRGIK